MGSGDKAEGMGLEDTGIGDPGVGDADAGSDFASSFVSSLGSDSRAEGDANTSDPMVSIRPQLPPRQFRTATVQLESEADLLLASTREEAIRLESGGVDDFDATQATGNYAIPVFDPKVEDRTEGLEGTGYELLDQIGIGGMGEVWEARQRCLGRSIALKRLRKDRGKTKSGGKSSSIHEQFESEARFAGALDHPNIITIHEYGHDQDGRVFYTMKLVEGTPWSELISKGRRSKANGEIVELELRDHLDILLEVSQAIAFAHSRGVIHRDIKPANVMIGDYGEVLVVDWGLAVAVRELDALGGDKTWTIAKLPDTALTCGTPAYMAPETASATRERIGTATDVYLLGAVLFHLLYGRPPHKGKSVKEVITKAKVNAFAYPRVLPGRVKPWNALLRPVLNRALATDPVVRYVEAGEFGDALRRALRNYDSAKVASRAQDKLARLIQPGGPSENRGYQPLGALIAQLEGALESWPRNLAARQTLAQAQLELASLALENGDLNLAKISIESYEQLPPLPEPRLEGSQNRRLTLHPVDGTLVNAPRPTDSLVAAGTSNEWGSAPGQGSSARGKSAALAATIGAARRESGILDRSVSNTALSSVGSVASVQIQQDSSASMVSGEQRLLARAMGLSARLEQREQGVQTKRRNLWAAGGLSAVLLVAFAVAVVVAVVKLDRQSDRASEEREVLSRLLLEETANTVEARLELQFRPVHAALMTSAGWAQAGILDVEDPIILNRYFMALLAEVDVASSMLRADTAGSEYMLLSLDEGWRTRSTSSGESPVLQNWNLAGEPSGESWRAEKPYDPHSRPWYIGGAGLRGEARRTRQKGERAPVFWTEPYRFFTTKELGLSVSTPATSVSGRAYVLAFDLRLGDVSSLTSRLPEGIEAGQVFVLDDQFRVLGLPRETIGASAEERQKLILTHIGQLDAAPVSKAAFLEWESQREAGDEDPVRLEFEGGETYWVGMQLIDEPELPKMWIGVVVPESHFLDSVD